jgi:hypothetical protein
MPMAPERLSEAGTYSNQKQTAHRIQMFRRGISHINTSTGCEEATQATEHQRLSHLL